MALVSRAAVPLWGRACPAIERSTRYSDVSRTATIKLTQSWDRTDYPIAGALVRVSRFQILLGCIHWDTIVLLTGGDKSSQASDILKARQLAKEMK